MKDKIIRKGKKRDGRILGSMEGERNGTGTGNGKDAEREIV